MLSSLHFSIDSTQFIGNQLKPGNILKGTGGAFHVIATDQSFHVLVTMNNTIFLNNTSEDNGGGATIFLPSYTSAVSV